MSLGADGGPMQFVLDQKSGVPFYRQIIDQIQFAIANGRLGCSDRLPTVRQLAVDLKINPNTVARAYQELEIKGVVSTQMGTGTFISDEKIEISDLERKKMLDQICTELLSRTATYGFSVQEVLNALRERSEGRPS
ncbi:MAG: GntR family transcriptional regulator [Planctomycetota bacterium]